MGDRLDDILPTSSIILSAKEKWDAMTSLERKKVSKRYEHFFKKLSLQENDWTFCFDNLSPQQRVTLIKSELIRRYDALSNKEKSKLKRLLGMEEFSSKWYKLHSGSKKKLLSAVIDGQEY